MLKPKTNNEKEERKQTKERRIRKECRIRYTEMIKPSHFLLVCHLFVCVCVT